MSELPNGWTRATLDAIADVRDFEREPINSSDRESRISGKSASELYPYYGATGQVGLIDSYRSEGQRVLLGEDAAPFLDPVKEKAYLANGRFWVNNHAHVLAGAAGLIDNRFLCHQLNTVDYHPFVTGSTRLKLTSAAMKQIPLVIAPAAEQTRIVEKLEELLSDLDAGVAELKAAQKRLGQYRQSLLKAAVEGAKKSPLSPNPSPARGEGSRGLTHGSSHAKGEGSGSLVPGSSHASGLRRRNRYPSPPPARERCLCSLGVSRANARRPVSCPPLPSRERGWGRGGKPASHGR
ncbi:MAG: restriction endonuclease subunit S [Porticoccaceae bacterium]